MSSSDALNTSSNKDHHNYYAPHRHQQQMEDNSSRYPRSYSVPSSMANLGHNNPDIISHQPTPMGGHITNNSNNSNNNNDSRAPWTYVPSGSTPLQRQDFHSSTKGLSTNGYYSSMDNVNATTTTTTTISNLTTTPTITTNIPLDDEDNNHHDDRHHDDNKHRRVSCSMSQQRLSTTSLPVPKTSGSPGTSAFGSRDWSSDLFESFIECRRSRPVSSSLRKFFRDCLCVPCMMCDIAKSLGDKMCLPFIPGTGAAIRFKVRILGGIQGTIADDCLVTSCCCPCAVCQMYREIDDIGLATR